MVDLKRHTSKPENLDRDTNLPQLLAGIEAAYYKTVRGLTEKVYLTYYVTHTCRLHPLGRNTTTCNLSHTLHFRGVNNTSGFPGFAARASVYLQTSFGGMPAWRIRNPQLQPSSSNCSQIFCNRSRASPIAAPGILYCSRSAAIADTLIFLAAYFSNTTCNWAGELHGGFANLQLQPSERTHLKVALLTKRHSRGFVQVADTLAAAGRCSRDQLRRRWLCWRCARTQLRRRVVRALHGVPERRRA